MEAVSAIDTKRPTRMVVIAYLAIAVSSGAFLERVIAAIFGGLRMNDPPVLGLADWTVSSVLGYAVAAAIAVAVWMNPRVNGLSFEVANELKKVTWPNVEDTRTSTMAVVVFSIVSAGVLGVFDVISSKIMTQWIPSVLDWMARHV